MNITEVRVKLLANQPDKLRAFASVTIDDGLVVRDLKVIEGNHGPFVAMPSRKLCDRCPSCAGKNHLRARYCNDCGHRLRTDRGAVDERGRVRLYADIAHPINQEVRAFVEESIFASWRHEQERAKESGYIATSFDDMDYDAWEAGAVGGP